MFNRNKIRNTNFVSLGVATLLLVVTFALIGFVALSVLIGNNFGGNRPTTSNSQRAVSEVPVGTPNPLDTLSFSSAALGFKLEYPRAWRKNEKGLQVIFSPSENGLNPDNLQEAAIWFGIPADNTTDPLDLLRRLQTDLLLQGQMSTSEQVSLNPPSSNTVVIGTEPWHVATLNFDSEPLGASATAKIATTSKNEVGYFMVAVAPAEDWNAFQPAFQQILNSFQFTTEAVLRPTDATPPPTPTATPTPVIYVVKSGDTLLQIALQYDVDVEVLAARNGIEDPRYLRTGVKLIIPLKRR